MIKDIRYGGYTAIPSDYDCPDGQLSISINMINENGALKPLFQPNQFLFLDKLHTMYPDADVRVLMMHRLQGRINYIATVSTDTLIKICWFEGVRNQHGTVHDDAVQVIAEFIHPFEIKSFAILGNTICIASEDGLHYFIWRDNRYICLSAKPPLIPISFIAEGGGLPNIGPIGGDDVPTDTDDFANHVFGVLNRETAHQNEHGRFTQPFFVRYAMKFYDGSYILHSAPILMALDVRVPDVRLSHDGKKTSCANIGHTLKFRILDFDEEALRLWDGLIAGIDIFVSAPIYTYDQSGSIPKDVTGEIHEQSVKTRPVAVKLPNGIVCVNSYGEGAIDNGNPESFNFWNIPINEQFSDDLQNSNLFYLIRSIEFNDLFKFRNYDYRNANVSEITPGLTPPEDALKETLSVTPSSLVNRPRLNDDYDSRQTIIPTCLFAYNNRITIANIIAIPPQPLIPLEGVTTTEPTHNIEVSVSIRKNGRILTSTKCYERRYQGAAIDPHSFDLIFPFIFYPETGAYKTKITVTSLNHQNSGEIVYDKTFPMKSHPTLNGAYYWIGETEYGNTTAIDESQTSQSVHLGNKIAVSEIENPFYFPLSGMTAIGTGEILGISTNAKALSQGQFGQFPLYAFCTDGVWAMEIAADGRYSSKQPVSRDVCINASAITQTDVGVLFPTAKGIMSLSGSIAQLITSAISSDLASFSPSRLPHINNFIASRYWLTPDIINMAFDEDYLQNCGIIYDYKNKLLYVFHKSQSPNDPHPLDTTAFTYSLSSQQWGMIHIDGGIRYPLNSYPDTYAVSGPGLCVFDFSQKAANVSYGLLLTRPLKLDAPDALKTVDTVIQRGNFSKGAVKCILYGSRNLRDWQLVWSSKDHYMRGFSGTPYKYYRVAVLTELEEGESLSGMTIQFTPRMLDQPR